MWDSDYNTGMKFGSELLIVEMVSLRCGYYLDKVNDKDETIHLFNDPIDTELETSSYEKYKYLKEFTYGFGIYIPLYKFTEGTIPLNIKFDYANMKYPESNDLDMDYDNINSYSLSINWLMRLKN